MRQRGLSGWSSWDASADVLAAQAADPAFLVWVLADSIGAVVGCTSLYEQSPPWFWTDAEQSEPLSSWRPR